MKKILLQSVLFLAALSILGESVGAMPLANAPHETLVTNVDWQCGRGWHVTSWGGCRPNRPASYQYYAWPYRDDDYGGYDWEPGHGWHHKYGWSDDNDSQHGDYGQDDDDDNSGD